MYRLTASIKCRYCFAPKVVLKFSIVRSVFASFYHTIIWTNCVSARCILISFLISTVYFEAVFLVTKNNLADNSNNAPTQNNRIIRKPCLISASEKMRLSFSGRLSSKILEDVFFCQCFVWNGSVCTLRLFSWIRVKIML